MWNGTKSDDRSAQDDQNEENICDEEYSDTDNLVKQEICGEDKNIYIKLLNMKTKKSKKVK